MEIDFEFWQAGELPPIPLGGGDFESWQAGELPPVGESPPNTATANITLGALTINATGETDAPPVPRPSANREPVFYARLQNPDFTELLNPPFALNPIRWGWIRPGGCAQAEIEVTGTERNIWQSLPRLLRSPVRIYNNNHTNVWWGFVNQIELYANDTIVGLSLDGMYNSVRVSYSELAGGGTSGTPTITSAASDTDSISRYGTKELLHDFGDATVDQAEAIRDGLLAAYRYILPDVRPGSASGIQAKLICRGWWDTLGWQYYENVGTTEVALSDQIEAIVTDAGEFFTGTDLVDAHTVDSNEYRDDTETALDIITALLQTPQTGGERVTAYVTRDRLLRFEQEAESGLTDWLLLPGQQFRTFLGGTPDPGREIIGWTQSRGVLPTTNWGHMISPTPLYIEENEFDAESKSYSWRARGALSPWG